MNHKITGAALLLAAGLFGATSVPARAEIASGQAFQGAEWKLVAEIEKVGSNGLVQSICCTKDYIICLENCNDATTEPDSISAYYRNSTDENGNPVEQYSLAKRLTETDYGHANGMAYNPTTNEIVVSEYSSQVEEDYGCVYIIDATTLQYKETRKVSDDWTLLGIDYLPEQDAYLIQTNADGGYRFLIMSNEFEIVEDWGSYPDSMTGRNFQDLCASGDYFINFPLTKGSGKGEFVEVYSISQKQRVDSVSVDFHFDSNIKTCEPEGVCETDPGVFVTVVNVYYTDGRQTARLYETSVPYLYSVSADAENGSVSFDTQKVYRGDSCTVGYEAEEGYEITSIRVDDVYVDPQDYPDAYTFADVADNHTIEVYCSLIGSTAANRSPDGSLVAENVSAPSVRVSTASASIPESQSGSLASAQVVEVTWIKNLGMRLMIIVFAILLFIWSYLNFSRYLERKKRHETLARDREFFRKSMESSMNISYKDREIWEKYSDENYID